MATCEYTASVFTAEEGNLHEIPQGWIATRGTTVIENKKYIGVDATDDTGHLHAVVRDCANECDALGRTYTGEAGFIGKLWETVSLQAEPRACCVPTSPPDPCVPPFVCVPTNSEAECNALGGVYLPDSSCSQSPCGEPVPCLFPPPDCPEEWDGLGPCHLFDSECNRFVTQLIINFSGIVQCIPGPGPLGSILCHVAFWNSVAHCFGCLGANNLENVRRWVMIPPTGACQSHTGTSIGVFSIQRGVQEPGGPINFLTNLSIKWGPPGQGPVFPIFTSFGEDDFFVWRPSCPTVNQILSVGWPNQTVCTPSGVDIAADLGFATVELPRFEI